MFRVYGNLYSPCKFLYLIKVNMVFCKMIFKNVYIYIPFGDLCHMTFYFDGCALQLTLFCSSLCVDSQSSRWFELRTTCWSSTDLQC